MEYVVNIFLDNTAQKVGGGGPHSDAYLAAHLWFKYTGAVKGWIPVADPVTLSVQNDRVGFTVADIYGELDNNAIYKIAFANPGGQGARSPLDATTTTELGNGSYAWTRGNTVISGLMVAAPWVTTAFGGLPLANQSPPTGFEFSIEVDDQGTERYYLDPRMIVGP